MSITLDAATRVTRDGKKASVLDLKAGLYVVVDASGDSLDELLAIDVRIVPPPSKKQARTACTVVYRPEPAGV